MSGFRLPLYLALTMIASSPAAFAQAEETVYIGGSGQLAVEIDLDSLDAPYAPPIGAASSVGLSFSDAFRGPQLLMPNSLAIPGEPVMLTPPETVKIAEKTLKPSPKLTGLTLVKPPLAAPTPSPVKKAEMAPPRAPKPPPPAEIEEIIAAEEAIEVEEVVEVEDILAPEPPPAAPEIEEIAEVEIIEEPAPPPPPAETVEVETVEVETVEVMEETVTEVVTVEEPAPPPPPAEAFVAELDSAETIKAPPPPPTEIEEMTEETTIVEESMAPVPMAPPPMPVIEDMVEETVQTEIATLPPAPKTTTSAAPTSGPVMVVFEQDSAVLDDSAKTQIRLIEQNLTADDSLRLQLVAFATGSEDNPSRARRLSLSRALAIRSFLVESGVKSTRMDVRALGNKIEGSPGDRVDLVLIER